MSVSGSSGSKVRANAGPTTSASPPPAGTMTGTPNVSASIRAPLLSERR